jgi:hypothetical protein
LTEVLETSLEEDQKKTWKTYCYLMAIT